MGQRGTPELVRVSEMVGRGGVRITAERRRRKTPPLERREGGDGCRDRQVCSLGGEGLRGANEAVKEQVQQMQPRGHTVRVGHLRGSSGRAGFYICVDGQVHGSIWETEVQVGQKKRSLGMRTLKNQYAKGRPS